MKVEFKEVTVRDLVSDYKDELDLRVTGYGGRLDIRPIFQREFVYQPKERDAVIDTLYQGFPLNVMYWAVKKDGNYEIIDGQQRTISICQFVNGDFSFAIQPVKDKRYFHNLKKEEKEKILNYQLSIYLCTGTEIEKLKWFKTINIAGMVLEEQELKNAVYAGAWVTDAKRYFSKDGCPAYQIGSNYINGSPIRQKYLETAIKWISNDQIGDYMGEKQHDISAEPLWDYFESVIEWIEKTFINKRTKFMKGVDWGSLYNSYKNKRYNPEKIEKRLAELVLDDDVTKKSGIYPYVLTGDKKYLSIRSFTDAQKQKTYEKQKGLCKFCKKPFDINQMEADHIKPWHEGGKTIEENCQMLCKDDNRRKSGS